MREEMATMFDLEAIKARANAATKRPWVQWDGHGSIYAGTPSSNTRLSISGDIVPICEVGGDWRDGDDDGDDDCENPSGPPLASLEADADFIAHARDDVPALVNEVERLTEINRELMGELNAEQLKRYEVESELVMLQAELSRLANAPK